MAQTQTSSPTLYFVVQKRFQSRRVQYNKRDLLRNLTEALEQIPEPQRPALHETGIFFCVRYTAQSTNDVLMARRLIEAATLRTHKKAPYVIGFRADSVAGKTCNAFIDEDPLKPNPP